MMNDSVCSVGFVALRWFPVAALMTFSASFINRCQAERSGALDGFDSGSFAKLAGRRQRQRVRRSASRISRTNVSPFTKRCRARGALMRFRQFFEAISQGAVCSVDGDIFRSAAYKCSAATG